MPQWHETFHYVSFIDTAHNVREANIYEVEQEVGNFQEIKVVEFAKNACYLWTCSNFCKENIMRYIEGLSGITVGRNLNNMRYAFNIAFNSNE